MRIYISLSVLKLVFSCLLSLTYSLAYAQNIGPKPTAKAFCTQLASSLAVLEKSMGFDPSQTATQRLYTAQAIIEGIRLGTVQEYLPLQYLVSETNRQGFVPLDRLLAVALNVREPLLTINNADELKNLPIFQQGSHLLLVTHTAEPLNQQRLKALVYTALRMRIKISVLWWKTSTQEFPGAPNDGLTKDALILSMLAASTSGQFFDLNHPKNLCEIVNQT